MIAIIKGIGYNTASIKFALERLNKKVIITSDHNQIAIASHVILPGVGFASTAMEKMKQTGLDKLIIDLQQPVLGICLGMQLLYDFSTEGDTKCLGVIEGKITKIKTAPNLPLPHMGWSKINYQQPHDLLKNINNNSFTYFVHSYCAPVTTNTIASSLYAQPFSAIVGHNNFYGMQFHPERSGKVGEQLLANFLNLR